MMKILSKFALDIFPSVIATIIGAYIVNHYIVAKPAPEAPAAVAAAPSAATGTPEAAADTSNIPQPGVRAKGISEKAIQAEAPPKPQDNKLEDNKPVEQTADTPVESASLPAEPKHRPWAGRGRPVIGADKEFADKGPKTAMMPTATISATPSAEAAGGGDDRHDANNLARAAIDRLRSGSASAHPEVARLPEAPRNEAPDSVRAEVARSTTAMVQPLPPPIVVSTPGNETSTASIGGAPRAPSVAAGADDPTRPTPPADIPSRPLELHAEAATAAAQDHGNVANDMLAAAKSVFHAVLPK